MVVLIPSSADQQLPRPTEEGARRWIHTYRDSIEIDNGGADTHLFESDVEVGLGCLPHPVGLHRLRNQIARSP
jgi:hypothetical protein